MSEITKDVESFTQREKLEASNHKGCRRLIDARSAVVVKGYLLG